MGKSTMAAWLTARGYALVSDDLTRFDIPAQGQPTIYPSAPRLKLWRDALSALEWSSAELERDHFRADKFHLPLAEDGRQQPLPLRAIYLLEWGECNIIRLSGGTAVRRFVSAATYRGALLEPMGKMGAYWQQCLELDFGHFAERKSPQNAGFPQILGVNGEIGTGRRVAARPLDCFYLCPTP